MTTLTKKKLVVYVVKDRQLLVFRHLDFSYEEIGIQVPAGSIRSGESELEKATSAPALSTT
jgi:hypothetical protein